GVSLRCNPQIRNTFVPCSSTTCMSARSPRACRPPQPTAARCTSWPVCSASAAFAMVLCSRSVIPVRVPCPESCEASHSLLWPPMQRRERCMNAWKSNILPCVVLTWPLVMASVLPAAPRNTCTEMMHLLDRQEGAVLLAFPEVQNDESFHRYK